MKCLPEVASQLESTSLGPLYEALGGADEPQAEVTPHHNLQKCLDSSERPGVRCHGLPRAQQKAPGLGPCCVISQKVNQGLEVLHGTCPPLIARLI